MTPFLVFVAAWFVLVGLAAFASYCAWRYDKRVSSSTFAKGEK